MLRQSPFDVMLPPGSHPDETAQRVSRELERMFAEMQKEAQKKT